MTPPCRKATCSPRTGCKANTISWFSSNTIHMNCFVGLPVLHTGFIFIPVPAVEPGQPDPAQQKVIFSPRLCCFSLLQSLSRRRSTNKDISCSLWNHCIWLWNLALIPGLIPLLLRVPWKITVFGKAQGTWGLSAPKTYLSTRVPFSTDNLLAGERVSHKPHQWHSQSALLQNAHVRDLCKEIRPRFKSSVNKSLILQVKFVQIGCIF